MGDCNCRRDAATCFFLSSRTRTAIRTRTPGTKCSIIIMCLVNYCVKSRLANKLSQPANKSKDSWVGLQNGEKSEWKMLCRGKDWAAYGAVDRGMLGKRGCLVNTIHN